MSLKTAYLVDVDGSAVLSKELLTLQSVELS